MKSHHECNAAYRRMLEEQERVSTDPAWVREQMGKEQFSAGFIIVAACVGALALYGVFAAVASI